MPDPLPANSGGLRPPRNLMGEAFVTLVLYYVGLGVSGFIANLYFLRRAQRERDEGLPLKNAGCLVALLWFHIALFSVIGVGVLVTWLRGGF